MLDNHVSDFATILENVRLFNTLKLREHLLQSHSSKLYYFDNKVTFVVKQDLDLSSKNGPNLPNSLVI